VDEEIFQQGLPTFPTTTQKRKRIKSKDKVSVSSVLHILPFTSLPTPTTASKMKAQQMNRGTEAMKAHLGATSEMEGT
jgi:hypothetical protein